MMTNILGSQLGVFQWAGLLLMMIVMMMMMMMMMMNILGGCISVG